MKSLQNLLDVFVRSEIAAETTRFGNCSVAIELTRYIEWFLSSPQADVDVEYHLKVPVSDNIAAVIRRSVLERMTCDGQPLMDLVRRQKHDEAESLKKWKLPVQIVTPVVYTHRCKTHG